jgi:hypothetical protein
MPIIIETPSPIPTSTSPFPNLMTYRYALADAAGFNIRTQTTATAAQANQVVVADFQSTELEDSFLGNTWEYQPLGPNQGQVRRVVYQGLATGSGTVNLERPHTAITPAGTPVEFYGKLPPVRYEGKVGLNDLVNKVLQECWTVQKLSIPAVPSQKIYPMGQLAPWLMAEDQVVEVYSRGANADPYSDDNLMINWRWVSGADNPGIEIAQTLNAGDTLKPLLYIPMSWWLNIGGNGFQLQTTEGLLTDIDQGILPVRGMEIIGESWLYHELSKWGLPEDQQTFRQLRAQSRAAANEWKRLTLEHPKPRKQHWPSVLTVRSRDNYGFGYTVLTPG